MIERSVGSSGVNDHNDTLVIQCALNAARAQTGLVPIAIDGFVGPETIGAILAFQQKNPGLAKDGRIDPKGKTLATLTTFIGGEEFVFAPIVQQVLAIKSEMDGVFQFAPFRAKRPFQRIMQGLTEVSEFAEIAKGMPATKPQVSLAFNRGSPNFGFVGADDAVAAATLAMMALIMALLLVLIIQSPAFRKAVAVRAKELDRIMRDLQINSSVGLKESVDIISAIFTDTKEEEQRCRQSPTFVETPECAAAIRAFAAAVAKMRSLLPRLIAMLNRILDFAKRPHTGLDIRKTRLDFNKLLAEAQALAAELQFALADMRQACKCPDEP
jgi:hypothetical protein